MGLNSRGTSKEAAPKMTKASLRPIFQCLLWSLRTGRGKALQNRLLCATFQSITTFATSLKGPFAILIIILNLRRLSCLLVISKPYSGKWMDKVLIKRIEYDLYRMTGEVKRLQCYICETPDGNTNPNHDCFTNVENLPMSKCPGLEFQECFTRDSSFRSRNGTTFFSIERGCRKGAFRHIVL